MKPMRTIPQSLKLFLLVLLVWATLPTVLFGQTLEPGANTVSNTALDGQEPNASGLGTDAAAPSAPATSQTATEVALGSYNGSYVAAEGGGGGDLNANRSWVREWETYSIVDINGGSLVSGDYVYIRTWNGYYLCAEGGGGGDLNATRTWGREWETFRIWKTNGGGPVGFGDTVNFQTYSGYYVVADYSYPNGKVRADRTWAREWETFTLGHGRPAGLGLMTGNYHMSQGPQPYINNPDRFMCEFNQLGARWIRMQVGWNNTPEWVTQKLVAKAHASGIKVNVVVDASYPGGDCDAPYDPSPSGVCAQRDRWLESYINNLNRLATQIFVGNSPYGDARADSFEIINEPNAGLKVRGSVFAWLLRKVWEWKALNRRPELIISGGTLNSYYDSPYETPFWNPFLNSRAFTGYAGSRPFDYLGVHPYNPYSIDQNCLNYRYSSACFNENPSYWKNTTINSLRGLAGRIDAATGTSGTRIFVTEFGWQLPTTSWGTCRIPDDTHSPKNCVNTTAQMVDGMQAAWDAFNQSGVVIAAQWHEYRDNAPPAPPADPEDYGRFGLRLYWNGSTFPVKEDVWQRFRTLAGGTGSSGACGP